jgi:hypothetical protein
MVSRRRWSVRTMSISWVTFFLPYTFEVFGGAPLSSAKGRGLLPCMTRLALSRAVPLASVPTLPHLPPPSPWHLISAQRTTPRAASASGRTATLAE